MLKVIIICIAFLIVQLLLCFKTKKLVVKLIPASILLIDLAVFIILMKTTTGWGSLRYCVFAILSGMFFVACGIGWIIWLVCSFIKKKRSKSSI